MAKLREGGGGAALRAGRWYDTFNSQVVGLQVEKRTKK